VALLRGVNVGGANKVPMPSLRRVAGSLGWRGARTHLASGNLVFDAEGEPEALARDLRAAIAAAIGPDVAVLVLRAEAVRAALRGCPYAPAEGKHVHAFFLRNDPVLDLAALEAFRAPSEDLVVAGRLAWLHAPEGIGRSRLAERLHKVVAGTDMTARNLNTLRALCEMVDDPGAG